MIDTQNYVEENRYVAESDWNAPSEEDMNDYLTGNLLSERPVSA